MEEWSKLAWYGGWTRIQRCRSCQEKLESSSTHTPSGPSIAVNLGYRQYGRIPASAHGIVGMIVRKLFRVTHGKLDFDDHRTLLSTRHADRNGLMAHVPLRIFTILASVCFCGDMGSSCRSRSRDMDVRNGMLRNIHSCFSPVCVGSKTVFLPEQQIVLVRFIRRQKDAGYCRVHVVA